MSDSVLDVALLKVLRDRVRAADEAVRTAVLRRLGPGDRLSPQLPDGTRVEGARVTVAEGRRTLAVVDDAAFLAWVLEHHPDEVETVQRVRPAYVTSLAAGMPRDPGPVPDPGTGEVIPGVEVRAGDPYVTVSVEPAAAGAIVAAWRDHGLLPQLLNGGGPDA